VPKDYNRKLTFILSKSNANSGMEPQASLLNYRKCYMAIWSVFDELRQDSRDAALGRSYGS